MFRIDVLMGLLGSVMDSFPFIVYSDITAELVISFHTILTSVFIFLLVHCHVSQLIST